MNLFNEIKEFKEVSYFDLANKFNKDNQSNEKLNGELDRLLEDGVVIEEDGLYILADAL
ncbi:hypothetical protein [Inconstantimicrobium mannanitabidum]|uniref:Uncharacterized protein n=1 Tax=Inconstantimicrobium mannanitabidum TaxID=1604901 RepID=A0ACB5RB21_9CLOT|nr:hypothetical protein [Clostridium sp. TW13]GKX66054.1 hypothetical protein rsdtw13_13120 [Clostridium sp. TW13]